MPRRQPAADRSALIDHAVAAAAGFAEATFFVVVPDVWTSRVAFERHRRGLATAASALAGALAGGAVTHAVSRRAGAARTRSWLTALPGITDGMVDTVEARVGAGGHLALITGPSRGIPYKVFARCYGVDAARPGRGLGALLLASVPARLPRFLLVTGGVGLLGARLRRRAPGLGRRGRGVLFWTGWGAFYAWYLPAVTRAYRR